MKATCLVYFGREQDLSLEEKELERRLNFRGKFDWKCLPQAGLSDPIRNREIEALALFTHINDQDFLIVCDEGGQEFSSAEWAQRWQKFRENHDRLVVVIGGAYGVDHSVRERADMVWSFGRATWSRNLARHMAAEQIYRADEINSGRPFHK